MNPKAYLQQVRKYDCSIENKLSEINHLKELSVSVTSTWKEDVVQTSGSGDKLGNIIAKIVDLQSEINEDVDKLVDLKREIMRVICSINDERMKNILFKRYFEFKSFEQIAVETGIGYQWVCKLHGRALLQVKAILNVKSI